MTAVYLSNNRILAVDGKSGRKGAVIHRCCSSTQTAPFMFNGSISDEAGFCTAVREFFRENNLPRKDVLLVLDSPRIITRRMKAPKQSHRGLLAFIRNDFSDLERNRHPVHAYLNLSTKGSGELQSLLAIETDSDYINDFIGAFKKCGVSISGVQAAICCGIRALKEAKNASGTYILQVLEETGFSSLLFVEGEYTYSSYTRLPAERDMSVFGGEIARSVNVIAQFAQAQHVGEQITDVLFAGFADEEYAAAAQSVSKLNADIRTDKLAESSHIRFTDRKLSLESCLFAAGGMLPAEKASYLLAKQEQSMEKALKRRRFFGLLGLYLGLGAVLLTATLVVLSVRSEKQAWLKELNDYNSSVLEQVTYREELVETLGKLRTRTAAASEFHEALQSYPLPNEKVRKELDDSAASLTSVEIISYNSATGELRLDILASEVEKINRFIDAIDEKASFQVMEYSGYEYDEAATAWRVSVVVTLAPNAGRGVLR